MIVYDSSMTPEQIQEAQKQQKEKHDALIKEVWGACKRPSSLDYSLCGQEVCSKKETCHRHHMHNAAMVLASKGSKDWYTYMAFQEDEDIKVCSDYMECK